MIKYIVKITKKEIFQNGNYQFTSSECGILLSSPIKNKPLPINK